MAKKYLEVFHFSPLFHLLNLRNISVHFFTFGFAFVLVSASRRSRPVKEM